MDIFNFSNLSLAEIGHFGLTLALSFAFLQATIPLFGAYTNRLAYMRAATIFASLQFLALALASAMLLHGFITSDFSIALVANNSHSLQPMLYKVTASWGNHEGSMLLWCLVLALYGILVSVFGGYLPASLKAYTLSVQGMITTAFLIFLIFTSNPFERYFPPPLEGKSLNPLLQDPGLVFHPPLLYLGYVGLSLIFSFAIAGLLEGKVDSAFARWVRPWTLVSWGFLTAGIFLGSWWAYYELGWGGIWFWDPVENASLMPWLATTALLHTAIVLEKRGTMKSWTILLAIIAFGLSLVGTFLVRSGALTSVHAFANDPDRGLMILLILVITLVGGLTLFAIRAPLLKGESLFQPVSREGAMMLNNILLVTALATVFLGTLYPLFLDAFGGDKLSVGEPYFNKTFGPIMIPLLLAVGVGPLLGWKRADLPQALRLIKFAGIFAIIIAFVSALIFERDALYAGLGMGLAGYLFYSALVIFWRAARPQASIPIRDVLQKRIWHLAGGVWGMSFAHMGLAFVVAGGMGATLLTHELITKTKIGEKMVLNGYEFILEEVIEVQGPNYMAERGKLLVSYKGTNPHYLYPERRHYVGDGIQTTEAAIETHITGDTYAVLGEVKADSAENGYVVRLYVKPMVVWLWLGGAMMVLGAVFSLCDRRLRFGTPIRKSKSDNIPEGSLKI